MTQISYENIPIYETNEPLVDASTYPFIIEPAYFNQGIVSDPTVYLREGVAEKLRAIQDSLHGAYVFKIWDAYRPRSVQDLLYNDLRSRIAAEDPSLTEQDLDQATQLYVTKASDPTRIPPHATGGTVDLTLVDSTGVELDMGTSFDHFGPEAAPWYFEHAGDSRPNVRANRHILIDTMTAAGFTVHDDEWWHFDYGNQVWAMRSHKPVAMYGEASLKQDTQN